MRCINKLMCVVPLSSCSSRIKSAHDDTFPLGTECTFAQTQPRPMFAPPPVQRRHVPCRRGRGQGQEQGLEFHGERKEGILLYI